MYKLSFQAGLAAVIFFSVFVAFSLFKEQNGAVFFITMSRYWGALFLLYFAYIIRSPIGLLKFSGVYSVFYGVLLSTYSSAVLSGSFHFFIPNVTATIFIYMIFASLLAIILRVVIRSK